MVRDYQHVLSAIYQTPRETTIYADISVDAEVVERFLAQRQAAGKRSTLTAVAALGVGHALRSNPDSNVVWRRGKFRARADVSTWIYGTTDDGHVLGGLVNNLFDGLDAVQERIDALSRRRSPDSASHQKSVYQRLTRWPIGVVRAFLYTGSRWVHDAGGTFGRVESDKGAYGAVGLTNVGSLGIPTAPAIPIPPFTRHVVGVSMGTIQDYAWVRDGKVVPGRRLPMTASLDHRAFVGLAAGRLMASFQEAFTDEALLERLARGLNE